MVLFGSGGWQAQAQEEWLFQATSGEKSRCPS